MLVCLWGEKEKNWIAAYGNALQEFTHTHTHEGKAKSECLSQKSEHADNCRFPKDRQKEGGRGARVAGKQEIWTWAGLDMGSKKVI